MEAKERPMPLVIPDELLQELGLDEREARIEIACRLFDAGKLSKASAGRLAGLSRPDFEAALIERGLPWVRIEGDDYWAAEEASLPSPDERERKAS